jgi:hypothetical protein
LPGGAFEDQKLGMFHVEHPTQQLPRTKRRDVPRGTSQTEITWLPGAGSQDRK